MIAGAVVQTEAVARERVISTALSWLGTPYHHHARVKGAGVDCGQFVAAVFEEAGVIPSLVPDDYPHDWHLHRSEERYLGYVSRYARPNEGPRLPGDIALYQYGRCISHGAIVVAWPQIIHAYIGLGVILDDAEANAALAQRFVGVWSVWCADGR
jgi:cell wall-associated NlpC family hydrolase